MTTPVSSYTTPESRYTMPEGYYTTPCVCGANPRYHLGHNQQCVQANRKD